PKPSTSSYALQNRPVLRAPLEPGQYLAIRYTERLAENGAVSSVGSRGDSFDSRHGRVDHRPLQDRTGPQPGTMAWTRRPRTNHPGMGGLVQPPKDLPRPRPHPTRRIREAPLPSNRVRPSGRDSHDRACMKPGEVQGSPPRGRRLGPTPAWDGDRYVASPASGFARRVRRRSGRSVRLRPVLGSLLPGSHPTTSTTTHPSPTA